MESWKKERIKIVEEYLKRKEFIILRGHKSWDLESDIDILCPNYSQKEFLKRYVYKNIKLDIFKEYKIKKIVIDFDVLKNYKKENSNELQENIESFLFFLKDYIHLTRYRKHKHQFYSKPFEINTFADQINCSKNVIYFLKPASNLFSFYFNSFIVKILYYLNI